MDYRKSGNRRTISAVELTFVRCDKDGNVITEEALHSLGITNSTIERIVSGVAGRISPSADDAAYGTFSAGIITD